MIDIVLVFALGAVGFTGSVWIMGDWPYFPATLDGIVREMIFRALVYASAVVGPGLSASAIDGFIRMVL